MNQLQALAGALFKKGTMTGEEVEQVVRDAAAKGGSSYASTLLGALHTKQPVRWFEK